MAGTATPVAIQHRSRGVVRTSIALVCDASGVTTAVSVGVGYGRLVGVLYDGGLDASATITIADGKTGAALVTYVTGTEGTPVAFRPTQVVTDNAGVAVTAATTAVDVNRDIYVAGKVTVAVASGGVSETATLALIVDETPIVGKLMDRANSV